MASVTAGLQQAGSKALATPKPPTNKDGSNKPTNGKRWL